MFLIRFDSLFVNKEPIKWWSGSQTIGEYTFYTQGDGLCNGLHTMSIVVVIDVTETKRKEHDVIGSRNFLRRHILL